MVVEEEQREEQPPKSPVQLGEVGLYLPQRLRRRGASRNSLMGIDLIDRQY